jgi:hypothetical protein
MSDNSTNNFVAEVVRPAPATTTTTTSPEVPSHVQATWDAIHPDVRAHLQLYRWTKSIWKISLKKGEYTACTVTYGNMCRSNDHEVIFSKLAEALENCVPSGIRYDARVEVNGYRGVHLYIGTSNYEEVQAFIVRLKNGQQ